MNSRLVVLAAVLAHGPLFGQFPASAPISYRLQQAPKRFRPELSGPVRRTPAVKSPAPRCVQPSPVNKSLSFKPCAANPPKMQLLPPLVQPPPRQ